jgi:hypothetical protein
MLSWANFRINEPMTACRRGTNGESEPASLMPISPLSRMK